MVLREAGLHGAHCRASPSRSKRTPTSATELRLETNMEAKRQCGLGPSGSSRGRDCGSECAVKVKPGSRTRGGRCRRGEAEGMAAHRPERLDREHFTDGGGGVLGSGVRRWLRFGVGEDNILGPPTLREKRGGADKGHQ